MPRKKVDNKVLNEEDMNGSTEAAQSLQPASKPADGAASKTQMMASAMNMMAGMDQETINKFMETLAQIGREADMIPDGTAENNAATIAAKAPAFAKEDLDAVFGSSDLSEEFKTKASNLFEAAISLRVSQETVRLEEEFESKLAEETLQITETLVDNMDKYLDYVIKEWVKENEVAIESNIRTEIAESFMDELRSLFESHYISIPEEKLNVVEELTRKVEELEEFASEQIQEKLELEEALATASVLNIFNEISEDLNAAQKEKLMGLTESISYDSIEDYRNKVSEIKENYFNNLTESSNKYAKNMTTLFEETEVLEEETDSSPASSGPMSAYVNTIAKSVKR